MRILISSLFVSLVVSSGMNADAQIRSTPTRQVTAMVEALRKAAPKTNNPNDGLYSDWQVKPETLRGWSKQCLGRELTPTQFANSPATARRVITCVIQDEFNQRLKATSNNEMKTVQSVACWWMTGQYTGCNSGATASTLRRKLSYAY